MVPLRMLLLIAVTAIAAALALTIRGPVLEPAEPDRSREYDSRALQGDLRGADSLFTKETELAARFHRRFIARNETWEDPLASPLARDVMRAYRSYWTRALMGEVDRAEGEAFLAAELRTVLATHGIAEEGGDEEVIARAIAEIEQGGLHALDGVTLPYFDLMIWARADTVRYEVEITDTVQQVTVIFLSDFLIKGWSHFATFGRAYTGGWATSDALYCLREDYDLDSEKFLVSYLKHECRHYADYGRFPALEQIDLEYRAKLTELAYAEDSLFDILRHFKGSGDPNPDAPHAYASHAVVRDLSRSLCTEDAAEDCDLRAFPVPTIHATARELLAVHSARLTAAGADTVRGVIRSPEPLPPGV